MIFVNYGGGHFWYFQHAVWNGVTITDLVFPWFLWMMGVSMVFAFRGILKRATPWYIVVWKIVWRAAKLYALGIILDTKWGNNLDTMRIPGILQRFSLTYLVTALVYYVNHRWAARVSSATFRKWVFINDIAYFWPEWVIHTGLLTIYLLLTFLLPVPGCPTGYLGPGGLAENGANFFCTGGAAGYADRQLFGDNHIYNWPTTMGVYYTRVPFDPEGYFTTIPTVFLCFLGVIAAKIIVVHRGKHLQILVRYVILAAITIAIGIALCEGKRDGGFIPINKNLWSMSFILTMAGTGFALLGVMYIIIDVFPIWNGAPFIYPGMNSIVIYACHGIFSNYFPVSWTTNSMDEKSHNMIYMNAWSVCFWLIVAFILHKQKIYVAL